MNAGDFWRSDRAGSTTCYPARDLHRRRPRRGVRRAHLHEAATDPGGVLGARCGGSFRRSRALADRRLRTDFRTPVRYQPPASAHALSLPIRVDAVMRAMTGSIVRAVDGRGRLVLAGEHAAYCEPRILTDAVQTPGGPLWPSTMTMPCASQVAVAASSSTPRAITCAARPGRCRSSPNCRGVTRAVRWRGLSSTLLFRPHRDVTPVVENVPFLPRQVSIGPDGSAYWLEATGRSGMDSGRPAPVRIFAPGCGFLRHEGGGIVLAPVTRPSRVSAAAASRTRVANRRHTARASGGPCRCGGAVLQGGSGAWTARAYPFSNLVRLENAAKVPGCWPATKRSPWRAPARRCWSPLRKDAF